MKYITLNVISIAHFSLKNKSRCLFCQETNKYSLQVPPCKETPEEGSAVRWNLISCVSRGEVNNIEH